MDRGNQCIESYDGLNRQWVEIEACRLNDEEEFLGEILKKLQRLTEEFEELRLLRFAADEMKNLRKRILSSHYD